MLSCNRLILISVFLCCSSIPVRAECNISDVLFGKVRIEIIKNAQYGYETGIIFGNDFDSERFKNDKILGQIVGAERDGSHRIVNTNTDLCGILDSSGRIDTSDADCTSCNKSSVALKKLGNGYAVMTKNGNIMGTIEGRLNR